MIRPPNWLAETVNRVATRFHSADSLAPLGCHYYHDEQHGIWEVTIFVSRTETVGGELDGKFTNSRFSVDLTGLESIFSEIERFSWQAASLGDDDDLGPHLAVEGRIKGHHVWLRIVANPPPQYEAGRIADAYDMQFRDRW